MRIAREGIPYIVVPAILAAGAIIPGYWPVSVVFLLLCAFMLFFFRDPYRQSPAEPDIIVAPADGRITRICFLEPENESSPTLVSIFLSPLDVHINRAPIAGKITDVSYLKGKFLMATNERASLVNEQNILTIDGAKVNVVCKQIAGILARRIVCWKQKNDLVELGERIGLIKFSSRTDLILPASAKVVVSEGMKVRGGTSIIARIQG